MVNVIYLIMSVAYNILYILVRNGIYKICAFAICEQTDVSHANRRHGAACMLAGVHLAACGVLRWCAVHVATSGAHPSTQAGHPPPPVGAPNQGMPPFSKIFFIFFEEGAISREIWDRCRVINIVKA